VDSRMDLNHHGVGVGDVLHAGAQSGFIGGSGGFRVLRSSV
jgi:hypothetical protein